MQASQQSSGFEVLDVSAQKDQSSKVEVKDDHIKSTPSKDDESPKKRPNVVGIKGFSETEPAEIDSPMRKKKKGLDKLKISQEPCEVPGNKFENLEKKFSVVMANFESKKYEYEDLRKHSKSILFKMKESGKL